jgi:hypothetical protein
VDESKSYELSPEQLRAMASAQGAITAADVALYRQALARGWNPPAISAALGFDAPYQAQIRAQLERQGLI